MAVVATLQNDAAPRDTSSAAGNPWIVRRGKLSQPRFLFKAARVVSLLEGLRPNPKKHLHFASDRRAGVAHVH